MAAITTGNHPKALWPGVARWFGAKYKEHPKFHQEMFEMLSSKKAYEEVVEHTGFGLAPVKTQGASVSYDSETQGETTRFTHIAYSLGYIVTREEMDDNLYSEVSRGRASKLAFSMATTKEVVAANVLNRGFNSSYTGGDGKELLATDHPSESGNQSNELATAADLSEASLEDILIQIKNAVNARGLNISLTGQCLMVAPDNEFEANRILYSTLQAGTANNDVNAMRHMGMLPKGIICNPYFTDADAWFVKTDAPSGLLGFNRNPIEFTRDNDFDTDNAKAKAYERYDFGWGDWRGTFGSPGS